MNPKHESLLKQHLTKLRDGTFDEHDVRVLLLGIREKLSEEAKRPPRPSTPVQREYQTGVVNLLDIAHSIAHPEMKERGAIRSYVRRYDAEYVKSLEAMKRGQKIIKVDPSTKTVHLDSPPALKTMSAQALTHAFVSNLPEQKGEADPWKLTEHGPDIELCLLSLLHLVQLPALDEIDKPKPGIRRRGYLAINSFGGFHSLYAGVYHSRTEGFLSSETYERSPADSTAPHVQPFPVFMGTKIAKSSLMLDARQPVVVFAERLSSGELNLVQRD